MPLCMTHKTYLGATIAALLPFFALQACTAGGTDEDVGISPDEIVEVDASCELGEARFCEQAIDTTVDGEQTCIDEDGVQGWTGCAPRRMDGPDDCREGEEWDGERCSEFSSGSTPIVLSFGGESVRYSTGGGDFDLTGRGYNVSTDWPTATTPWLALDRDGNGSIDSGAELFGSATRLASGAFARHGFEALAELDDDADGVLTEADAAFASLRLWADQNGDRLSQADELVSLKEAGVTSLSLDMSVVPHCDARNNCERERSSFTFEGPDGEPRTGAAIDVHLAWQ